MGPIIFYYLLKKKLILVADNYHGPWQWCIYGVRFQGDQSSLPKAVHNVQHCWSPNLRPLPLKAGLLNIKSYHPLTMTKT